MADYSSPGFKLGSEEARYIYVYVHCTSHTAVWATKCQNSVIRKKATIKLHPFSLSAKSSTNNNE